MKKRSPYADPKLRTVSHKARHLRHERDCLNCGHHIEDRFCSHCGQENTEKRQSFSHLVGHIFEDLTHYDSGFWVTVRYLLLRPGLLTNTYLSGKRASYVVPVKLYIFVSFICFFLPGILPDFSHTETSHTSGHHQAAMPAGASRHTPIDSLSITDATTIAAKPEKFRTKVYWGGLTWENGRDGAIFERPHSYKTVAQLDSAQKALPKNKRYNWLEYRMAKKIIYIYDHYSEKEIWDKFGEGFKHNIPKALFLYMPFFAFFIWLLHGKKRWLYFDHAIFTLHYFSLLLLVITLFNIEHSLVSAWYHQNWVKTLDMIVIIAGLGWMFVYFFVAHHRVYKESRFVSSLKSLLLFFVNMFGLFLLLLLLTNITLFTLH